MYLLSSDTNPLFNISYKFYNKSYYYPSPKDDLHYILNEKIF